ncbi:hypothetical protein [Deinococcus aquiradiocola]|uniref:Uncharacterized protein n=1 Tax=Deinococcus aquiradiocola TaxID=393059 RepID=A0A917PNL8_9DEIO|nr:hypothetical protein [Deinococcus aquiradiocola]GGJ86124.1 hypothetical protein GCM10008939_32490 [Deinococcus aquiradiocola]
MNTNDDRIVGRSVEEIEAETGNRVNSPVQSEDRQGGAADTGPVLVPAAVQSGAGSVTGVGAGIPGVISGDLTRDDTGSHDGRGGKETDSSEE